MSAGSMDDIALQNAQGGNEQADLDRRIVLATQHGLPLRGKAIGDFLDWLSGLECGIDLMGPEHYRVPY